MESTQSMEEAPPRDGDHEHGDDWSETSESADDSPDSDSGLEESVVDFHQRFAPVSEPSLADVYVNINSTVLHCVGPNGKFKCGGSFEILQQSVGDEWHPLFEVLQHMNLHFAGA